MKFDFDSMTPGISTLPSGSFTVLEQLPLVRVARVRRLEEMPLGRASNTMSMMSASGTSR